MSVNTKRVRILVSSPSDVQSERDALETAINELNLSRPNSDRRFELIRWETHGSPQAGPDTQAILNQQLTNDCDIFLGILWHRLGTATPRADSGTVEEFDRAYARFEKNPSDVAIMFYFKTASPPLEDIQPEQLARVREFRETLKKKALYQQFSSLDEFTSLVRIHLARWLNALEHQDNSNRGARATPSKDDEKSQGILDLFERANTNMKVMMEIANRLAGRMVSLGNDTKSHTSRLTSLASTGTVPPVREVRRVVDSMAQLLGDFANQVSAELSPMRNASRESFDSFGLGAQIAIESGVDASRFSDNVTAILNFANTADGVSSQIETFRETIRSMPRMTSPLNRARRNCLDSLSALKSELTGTANLARQTADLLNDLAKNGSKT
jgi:hypothetical protein